MSLNNDELTNYVVKIIHNTFFTDTGSKIETYWVHVGYLGLELYCQKTGSNYEGILQSYPDTNIHAFFPASFGTDSFKTLSEAQEYANQKSEIYNHRVLSEIEEDFDDTNLHFYKTETARLEKQQTEFRPFQITLNSKLLGKIPATVLPNVFRADRRVYIEAEVFGKLLIGEYQPDTHRVRFGHPQGGSYKEFKKYTKDLFRQVGNELYERFKDQGVTRDAGIYFFEIAVGDGLDEVKKRQSEIGLAKRFQPKTPTQKTTQQTQHHEDGCECEDCEWNDDQNFWTPTNQFFTGKRQENSQFNENDIEQLAD